MAKKHKTRLTMGAAIAIGVALGTGLGAATGNIALGIALGVVFAAALGRGGSSTGTGNTDPDR